MRDRLCALRLGNARGKISTGERDHVETSLVLSELFLDLDISSGCHMKLLAVLDQLLPVLAIEGRRGHAVEASAVLLSQR